MFDFRKLSNDDLPLMFEWLSKPHVKQWWDDGEDTLEKVALHYGVDDAESEKFILVEKINGVEKPIGYFQYYFAADGEIGIDQFIGEEDYLNKGVGERAIKQFVKLIVERHNPPRVIVDPPPENKRAIRCYEKVGFKFYENRKTDGGETARMMRLDAKDF